MFFSLYPFISVDGKSCCSQQGWNRGMVCAGLSAIQQIDQNVQTQILEGKVPAACPSTSHPLQNTDHSHSHGRAEGKGRAGGLYMFLNPGSLASPFIRHSPGCYKYPEFWDFAFLIYQLFQWRDPPLVLPGLSFCLMSVSVDFARLIPGLFCSVDDGVCLFWGNCRQPKLWICSQRGFLCVVLPDPLGIAWARC